MPVGDHFEPRARNQLGQNTRVDQRHQRVIVARQHQRGLFQQRQPGQAGPAPESQLLVDVAEPVRAHQVRAVRLDKALVFAHLTTVERGRDPVQVRRVVVAPRIEKFCQHKRRARHHQRTGRGGHQNQAPATALAGARELLCQRAAPGNAQHIDRCVVAQLVQHAIRQLGQPTQPVGRQTRPRATNAGHIEHDGLEAVQRVGEGLQQFEIGADAVEHQQWWAFTLFDADP